MSHLEGCGLSEMTQNIQHVVYFIAYYVILPVYFTLGMSGNVALLVAFYKQSKTDKAYAYQVFLTTSKTLEILFLTLFWWGYKWNAGVEGDGHSWYMNTYALMFYSAHIGCPLANGFIMTSLLLSVAMAADRAFALGKPFVYKCIDHRRHQACAVLACLFIGLATSAFEVMRWQVVTSGHNMSTYAVIYDEAYLNTTTAMAFGHTRTGVRLIGVGLLIVLNVYMVIAFRKRSKKVGQMVIPNDKKEQDRKATDKALLILTVYQSLLMSLAQLPHSGYFIAAFISATFSRCYGIVVAPIADSCIQISDAADLFVIISVNRKIRKAVFRLVPWAPLKPRSTTKERYSPAVHEWNERRRTLVISPAPNPHEQFVIRDDFR